MSPAAPTLCAPGPRLCLAFRKIPYRPMFRPLSEPSALSRPCFVFWGSFLFLLRGRPRKRETRRAERCFSNVSIPHSPTSRMASYWELGAGVSQGAMQKSVDPASGGAAWAPDQRSPI